MQNLSSDGSSPGTHREMGNGAGGAQPSPDYQLAGVVSHWAADPPRGLCTSHNKELFICSCSTVSTSWGAGVYVPGRGPHRGRDGRWQPPAPQLKKLWCFESHSPRSLEPDISDPGEKESEILGGEDFNRKGSLEVLMPPLQFPPQATAAPNSPTQSGHLNSLFI